MLREDPRLAKAKDFITGYTALHWAAKHGNLDLVKLLAGQYQVDVNVKSHGGYTPLHLSCQFSHQEVRIIAYNFLSCLFTMYRSTLILRIILCVCSIYLFFREIAGL